MKINLLILFVMMVFFAACSRQQKDALTITNYNIPEVQEYNFNNCIVSGNAPSSITDICSAGNILNYDVHNFVSSNEVASLSGIVIKIAPQEDIQQEELNFRSAIYKGDTTLKDTIKIEPKLEPLVATGTALMAAGVATSALWLLSNPFTIWIPVALFAASAIITAIGWRRIKNDPKKYKGEKFAVLNYLVIGIIGVAVSGFLIWLLFEL